ncbi:MULTISPECIES: metal ABC transporter substrate-binding protein [Methylosinus]|uniref:Metal ABC transporter substrate-binding protein n=1 Tax=Methylosinus trichosporium (strain ATCC 35070 / NCIMB 11131 / UNIQEM 75 / OB3b) TaxID=595536 RepID=A0A2D2D116_METT3|nr:MULTISPECIES: metal ABC transporter substrate-binding protein [Methylosinus]ATQ68569.1 metal ABC transporter substrate-binding protein [Methylosinus trichosporium OB3b]OBS52777.1 metal ABC transporter substrate-binding protein [Methylosinus sp. 3S-1]
MRRNRETSLVSPSRRRLLVAGALALVAPRVRAETPPHLPAVASFSILGDLVAEVGGRRLDLATIVGPDSDAHVYQPTPKDGKRLAGARIVFVNGLGFEGWIDRLIAASRTKATVATASRGVTPRKDIEGLDPHAWQSVANAKIYVANIRDALVDADPEAAEVFRANAEAYLERLGALDAEIKAAIEAIPKSRRRVVSTHDAFGYFAARYGLEFIAPEGVSTEAEPSARDVARIIDAARAHKVAAIFLENIIDPRLAQRIAAETGAKIGGTLYSDALSARGGPAPGYIEMMRYNVKQLTTALAS